MTPLEVEKVVHTSTSEVYGTARFVPITEDHPLQGQSPYSASKIGADQIAMSFFNSFETPVSILRPFNTYGPRQSARAVIPTVITQIANNQKQIKLGSLHPTRDFIYVDDINRFHEMIINDTRTYGQTYNLGCGINYSINEVFEIIESILKTGIKPDYNDDFPIEVFQNLADITKATQLGWIPEIGIKEGIKRSIDYIKNGSFEKYKIDNI